MREPLMTGWLTQGPKVARSSSRRSPSGTASSTRSRRPVARPGCTSSLAALGIGPGDEVIVPAFTWVATANVVVYCGATPVFADVDRDTYNIDPADVARRITPRTKAVIAVHLFGLCADIDALRRRAAGRHVAIIEDAACACGRQPTRASRRRAARRRGVLLVPSAQVDHHRRRRHGHDQRRRRWPRRAIMLRNHGASVSEEQRHHGPRPYLLPEFNLLGFNYRMTDLQGAVGVVQLAKLDAFIDERDAWAAWYMRELASVFMACACRSVRHMASMPGRRSSPTSTPPRRRCLATRSWSSCKRKGISTRPGTHASTCSAITGIDSASSADDFPAAAICDARPMAIPLHNRMSWRRTTAYVVEARIMSRKSA